MTTLRRQPAYEQRYIRNSGQHHQSSLRDRRDSGGRRLLRARQRTLCHRKASQTALTAVVGVELRQITLYNPVSRQSVHFTHTKGSVMSNFTFQVAVQVDVQNAENIHQARESVFALLSLPKETKQRKGRPTATLQTKATVTGVQIPMQITIQQEKNYICDHETKTLREVTETTP